MFTALLVFVRFLYRPPYSKIKWFNQFHDMMSRPYNLFTDILTIADFNINALNVFPKRWKQELEFFSFKSNG